MTRKIVWAEITVSSAKKNGTLKELNCSILPTRKAGASDDVISALNSLDKCFKALIRNGKTPSAINRQAALDHLHNFMTLSGLDENWDINFIAAAGAKFRTACKTHGEDCVLSALPTFKKSMLRLAIYAQEHNVLCTQEVKERSKKSAKTVEFNVYDAMSTMSPEQLEGLKKFLAAMGDTESKAC